MSETISREPDTRGIALVAALKAARASLGWSQRDLAAISGVSKVTIARLEAGMMSPRLSTTTALQAAMERAGIHLTLNEPTGGFSLRVEAKALENSLPTGGSRPPKAGFPDIGALIRPPRRSGSPRDDQGG